MRISPTISYLLSKAKIYLVVSVSRLKYFLAYGFPITDGAYSPSKVVSLTEYLAGATSIGLIGKGASIFYSEPSSLLSQCDNRILLNSVDVNNIRIVTKCDYDIQVTTHISDNFDLMPVLSSKDLKQYGISLLVCNNSITHNNGKTLERYWNYLRNYGLKIGFIPDSSYPIYDPGFHRFGPRLTIAANVLSAIYNVPTVTDIVFCGIDAFHFGYSYSESQSLNNRFYPIDAGGFTDPKSSHGKPFLDFLFTTLAEINQIRSVTFWFPLILKDHIVFPETPYVKFYD